MDRPANTHVRGAFVVLALVAGLEACSGPRLALTPIPVQDDDRYDVPEPKERVRDDYYDVLDYTLYQPTKSLFDIPRGLRALGNAPKQALNVTPLDEIQDSSWFTNRIGSKHLTAEELRQGPNAPQGPDVRGPWTIVRPKTEGVTAGFTIEDPRGDIFIIKFDPKADPELATGAEATSTRFYWAIGYNVPENYIVQFDPAILQIGQKATVRQGGKKRAMTRNDLDAILAKVPVQLDGRLRAIASRLIEGKVVGQPAWLGRRKDDPNDVIPHEHRRELRAYRVFCAWLHHNDSRQINAKDFFVEEDGRHFIKHYLIDFGATLGSRSYAINLKSEGYEYLVDFGTMFKSFASAGIYERPWTGIEYPAIRGVGRFEAKHFDPGGWKPDYPNPAFERLTPQDGFWGAKIVMRFDDALIRAAVEAAEFSDPRATDYITAVLIERRERIGRRWFTQVNPLDRFELRAAGGDVGLGFTDLAVQYGFEPARKYQVQIEVPGAAAQTLVLDSPEVPLASTLQSMGKSPTSSVEGNLIRVEIRSALPHTGNWTPAVRVTLLRQPETSVRIVAIDHDS